VVAQTVEQKKVGDQLTYKLSLRVASKCRVVANPGGTSSHNQELIAQTKQAEICLAQKQSTQ